MMPSQDPRVSPSNEGIIREDRPPLSPMRGAVAREERLPPLQANRSAPPRRAARHDIGVIDGQTLDAMKPRLIQFSSFALLGLSFLSAVVAFHRGDWTVWGDVGRLLTVTSLAGISLQVWATLFQWFNRHDRQSWWYRQAYVLDVVTTTVALAPVLLLTFQFLVGEVLGISMPANAAWAVPFLSDGSPLTLLAWVVAGIASHYVAREPEKNLISE